MSLQSIPENLFANNTTLENVWSCFRDCSKLKVFTLKIGSRDIYNYSGFVTPITTDSNIIIKVPSNSITQTNFNTWKSTNTNIAIIPY